MNAFYQKCGLVTFHGPMATTLPASDDASQAAFLKSLKKMDSPISLKECDVVYPGTVSGPLIGGNLTALCHLMGTPYQPDSDGCLLFIEDRGEALYRIDRMMVHLEQAGFLKGIKGMILGMFEGCGNYEGIVSLMSEVCLKLKIPLVSGFGAGHGNKNLTIPIGLPGVLDTAAMEIKFEKD